MKATNRFRSSTGSILTRVAAAILLIVSFSLSALHCRGQGTLTITFDGPPQPLSVSSPLVTNEYVESSMYVTGYVSRFVGPYFAHPYDGTVYLLTPPGEGVAIGFLDGSLFSLLSVDLTEAIRVFPTATVKFIGYRPDGSSIAVEFSTTGIRDSEGRPDFQTFYFRPEFTGIYRVEISSPDGYALDNLAMVIPEPRIGALLLLGGICFLGIRSFVLRLPATRRGQSASSIKLNRSPKQSVLPDPLTDLEL